MLSQLETRKIQAAETWSDWRLFLGKWLGVPQEMMGVIVSANKTWLNLRQLDNEREPQRFNLIHCDSKRGSVLK